MEDTQNAALLVMDMQVPMLGMVPESATLLANVAKAIAAARDKKIPVLYVVVGFRQGMPEVSPKNKGFAASKERFVGMNMQDFVKIHPDVAPQGDEMVITKRRVSGFSGSDLAVVLSALSIDHIVLTGIATGGVVLSTTRESADRDYRITILSDCCADADAEVHRVLTTKVFPRQADVLTVAEWIA